MPYLGQGKGFAGYAMLMNDMDSRVARMRVNGVKFDGPKSGGCRRTDGQMLRWRTLFFANTLSPFLIMDDTPRTLRVPDDAEKLAHANGATDIRELVVAASDLAAAAERYGAILGQTPQAGPVMGDAETLSFNLDGCTVTVAAPSSDAGSIAEHLREYGDSPYLCRVGVVGETSAGLLDLALSHQARFELINSWN